MSLQPEPRGLHDNGNDTFGLPRTGTIINACSDDLNLAHTLRGMLDEKLLWKHGPYRPLGLPQRLLPSPLLSDNEGLQLFKTITRLPNYYQLTGEVESFQKHGTAIASHVLPDSLIVDLGCGDVHKVLPLLDVIESAMKSVVYFALDLAKELLDEGMALLTSRYRFVKCYGLWGTFDDGIAWLNSQAFRSPRLFLSLGSIFGNDHFEDAVKRLKSLKDQGFVGNTDSILLTMDATDDLKVIWESYHDAGGVFERFVRNGYLCSNRVLGSDWYHDEDWDLVGAIQEDPVMHRFVLRAKKNVTSTALQLDFSSGTEIDCYEAFKYPPEIMRRQFAEAGFDEIGCWKAPRAQIYQYLLVPSKARATGDIWSLPSL